MNNKLSLNGLVRLAATNGITPNYTFDYLTDNARKEQHNAICAKMVEIADAYKVPMSFLAYFMVSKESHKITTFSKGFTKCDVDKAIAIIEMSRAFAEHNGYKSPTDRVYHAMTAFYERCSTDNGIFMARLAAMTPKHNFVCVKDICKALGM